MNPNIILKESEGREINTSKLEKRYNMYNTTLGKKKPAGVEVNSSDIFGMPSQRVAHLATWF